MSFIINASVHAGVSGDPPSYVGASTNGISSGGTLSLAYPSGLASGDRMVIAIACRNSDATTPSGWTQRERWDTSNGNDFSVLLTRTANGSESGSLAVSITGNSDASGVLAAFRNVGNYQASANTYNGATTPSIAGTAGGLVVHCGHNAFTGTGFTGWAEPEVNFVGTFYETAADTSIIMGYEVLTATGPTTGRTPVGDDGSDDGTSAVTFLPA